MKTEQESGVVCEDRVVGGTHPQTEEGVLLDEHGHGSHLIGSGTRLEHRGEPLVVALLRLCARTALTRSITIYFF